MIEWLDSPRPEHEPSVVCLGFFDGVHVGHQAILRTAKAISQKDHLVFCVHTYNMIPANVLLPDRHVPELTTLEEKSLLLAAAGVQLLAVSRFDQDLIRMSGASFIRLLKERLNARHIVAGFDHRFGYRGQTDAKGLESLGEQEGLGITVVEPVRTLQGETVSSTAIRQALARGDTQCAQRMLGRPVSERMLQLVPVPTDT